MTHIDYDTMSLQDYIDLRDRIDRELKKRFERPLALFFTDIVNSTAYVAEHGDAAGRELLHRHHAVLKEALANFDARVIDTAGDGAFCVATTVADAIDTLVRFHRLMLEDNAQVSPANRLGVRSGVHWGPVLADQDRVTGEAVHVASRIGDTGHAGEIRLSNTAFQELPVELRALCEPLPPQSVKGIAEPLQMLELDWRDTDCFATRLEMVELALVVPIPIQSRVTLGRLAVHGGRPANDIVLEHPDPVLSQRISRWHLELEMAREGYVLRSKSQSTTELDGEPVEQGQTGLVRVGSTVKLSQVLTLRFLGPANNTEETSLVLR